MKILAFDTSSTACSVALLIDGNITSSHIVAHQQQAQLILSTIKELLTAASITLEQLDAIAYGCGPGSFTGIRIANSVAQGLGFAAQKPLIPVSSLAAIAQAAYIEHGWDSLWVAVDARMKQVYWAAYQVNEQKCVDLIGKELLCAPNEIIISANKNESSWYGVGDAWSVYEETLSNSITVRPKEINPTQLPTAQALLALALVKFGQKDWVMASNAAPVYLR